jgi:hypothetical protein
MKEMNKKNYLSPMVEILNARVEKGFQTSTGAPEINTGLRPEVPGGSDLDLSMFD